jgi:hypothetical protein
MTIAQTLLHCQSESGVDVIPTGWKIVQKTVSLLDNEVQISNPKKIIENTDSAPHLTHGTVIIFTQSFSR